jgi:hypothetical protein
VDVFYNRGYTGEPHALAIWNMSGGTPNAIIATTDTLIYPSDTSLLVTYNLSGGPIFLPAGTYAFTAIEFDSTVQVGQTANIFNLGHTWVDWSGSPLGGWGNFEAFGTSFERANVIRPNLVETAIVGTSKPVVSANGLKAYPNPSTGRFTVEASFANAASSAVLTVMDVHGRTVFSQNESSAAFTRELDLSNLQAGHYFVKVQSGSAIRVTPLVIH